MPHGKKGPSVKEVPVHFVRRFQLAEKVCPVCGQLFMGMKEANYDRGACRQKASYARHATAYRHNKLTRSHRQTAEASKEETA